jgi:hypothetical protein
MICNQFGYPIVIYYIGRYIVIAFSRYVNSDSFRGGLLLSGVGRTVSTASMTQHAGNASREESLSAKNYDDP